MMNNAKGVGCVRGKPSEASSEKHWDFGRGSYFTICLLFLGFQLQNYTLLG